MNRTVRKILIVAAAMIPIGITAILLGVMFGGRTAWSYSFGNGKGVVQADMITDTVELDDFDSLKVDVSSVDVYLLKGDAYRLEYKVREGYEPIIEEKGGKLTIKQPSSQGMNFEFGVTTVSPSYTITVPQKADEIKLDAGSSSGDITVDGVNVSGKVEASSGDIELKNIKGDDIEVKTSSGEIMLSGLEAENVKANASSGSVTITGIRTEEIKCETSSGEIGIRDAKAEKVDCEASSGDVSVEIQGDADDYSYDLDSSSGDIDLNGEEHEDDYRKDADGDKKIKVKTTSGEIEVSVK